MAAESLNSIPTGHNSSGGQEPVHLVERALRGDRHAIEKLVTELSPVVQSRVAVVLWRSGRRNRQEVEDLTQDVFLQLFARGGAVLSSWDAGKGLSLTGFVGLVAERSVVSTLRSRRKSPYSMEPTEAGRLQSVVDKPIHETEPEGPAAARQMLRLLLAQMKQKLSEQGLEMFQRLYVWQQEPTQVAQETGLKMEAIYQWRTRLRKAMLEAKQELEGQRADATEPGTSSRSGTHLSAVARPGSSDRKAQA